MAVKLDEDTQLKVSIKTVAMIVAGIISVAGLVYHTEYRIEIIESTIASRSADWDKAAEFVNSFKPHPQVYENEKKIRELEIIIVRQQKDIEYLQSQLNKGK